MMRYDKKKLLWVSRRLPFPPVGGAKLKSYHMLQILSKHYKIYGVFLADEKYEKETLDFLNKHCTFYKIFNISKFKGILNTSKFMFNNLPLQSNYFYEKRIKKYIYELSKDMDLLMATSIKTSKYLIDIENKPKVFDAVDSVSINYERSLNNVKSNFWKFIYKIETPRLKRLEKKSIKKYDLTFYVNYNEAKKMAKYGYVESIPLGVNEKALNYENENKINKYSNYIIFMGKMNYQPNVEVVRWILENIIPFLKKDIKFGIIGPKLNENVVNIKKYPNVEYLGFVEDPYEVIKSSKIFFAPMQTGAGVQNKILEAMAIQKAVLTTSLGINGIKGVKEGKEILVENDPKKIVEIINNLDSYDLDKIGKNARKFIQNNFTYDLYEEKLIYLLNKLQK
jgi:hypothetical protein